MDKNFTLFSADALVEILRNHQGEYSYEDLKAIENELKKRIAAGECDESVLDGMEIGKAVIKEDVADETVKENKCAITPGRYKLFYIFSIIIKIAGLVGAVLLVYGYAAQGYIKVTSFETFVTSAYAIFEGLVRFGTYYIVAEVLMLVVGIASNCSDNKSLLAKLLADKIGNSTKK